MPSSRPPVKHAKTTSSIPRKDREVESVYYGLDPDTTTATSRPQPRSRPSSYYAPPPRPPPSNARFYASQTPGPPPFPPSFPPPSWIGPGPGPGPGPRPPPPGGLPAPFGPPPPAPLVMHHPPPPPPSEFYTRPLESRFGSRPQSAMGFRPPRAIEYDKYDDYEEPVERSLTKRRPSTTARKASKNDDDRTTMPPPRRPASARPTTLAFRPPPATPTRRRPDLDDHDPDVEAPLFNDLSPLPPGSYEYSSSPFRPRPNFAPELGYDPDFHTEVSARNHRRNSYYAGNSASSGSAYEDKMRQATRYQDDIVGGPQMPLTAETLRKAGRSGASSRSTRSSGSHDESEYRQSATTRTTRSTAPNDEDVTIRVKGSTVLKFGNAEMQCEDGAEINIISRGGNAEIRATGSDRSSYIDPDDRRTRVDMPQSRARAASRAKSRPRSYSRPLSRYDAMPKYDPALDYDGYTTFAPPLPPAYPEFPSSYSSRHGDGYFGSPL